MEIDGLKEYIDPFGPNQALFDGRGPQYVGREDRGVYERF